MDKTEAAGTFGDKLSFFNYGAGSYRGFPAVRRAVERYAPKALRQFYDHIRVTPSASRFFGSQAMMDHAKDKQLEHWRELFSRPLDAGYVVRAERIGQVHARIGLSPTFYIGGYARILDYMLPRMMRRALFWPFGVSRAVSTLVKASLLDMEVALSAYFHAEEANRRTVIDKVGKVFDAMANGDFTATLDLPEEYAALVADFEAMRTRMSGTLLQVAEAATRINSGSADVRAASDDLSQRTEQQAASIEQTAAAMDEITSTVRRTAADAGRANDTVSQARDVAEHSGTVVRRAVEAMGDIERSSAEISEIISLIDGISFQTNLLALNAGVEAARAGDAGKGFAVVASEVRALAQRSADAASDVKTRISASSEQVEIGVQLVSETGEALDAIIVRIGEVSQLVSTIASSAEQQSTGLQQVNTAVSEMDGVTQQNAAMVEEATAAARSLAAEADALAREVARFKLSGTATGAATRPVVHQMQDRAAKAGRELAKTARVSRGSAARAVRSQGNAAVAVNTDDWSEF
jgi:methyl-accepting chemotaxis protein